MKQNALSQGAIVSAFSGAKNEDEFHYQHGELDTVDAARNILYAEGEGEENQLLQQIGVNKLQSWSTNDIGNVVSRNLNELLLRDAATHNPYLLVSAITQLLFQHVQLQLITLPVDGSVLYSILFNLLLFRKCRKLDSVNTQLAASMVSAAIVFVLGDDGAANMLGNSKMNHSTVQDAAADDNDSSSSDDEEEHDGDYDLDDSSEATEVAVHDLEAAVKELLLQKKWDKLPMQSFKLLKKRGIRKSDKKWVKYLKLQNSNELVEVRKLLVSVQLYLVHV